MVHLVWGCTSCHKNKHLSVGANLICCRTPESGYYNVQSSVRDICCLPLLLLTVSGWPSHLLVLGNRTLHLLAWSKACKWLLHKHKIAPRNSVYRVSGWHFVRRWNATEAFRLVLLTKFVTLVRSFWGICALKDIPGFSSVRDASQTDFDCRRI